jgi:hypothetical protein
LEELEKQIKEQNDALLTEMRTLVENNRTEILKSLNLLSSTSNEEEDQPPPADPPFQ